MRSVPSRPRSTLALAATFALAATAVSAQSWRIDPNIAVRTTYSDNVALQPDAIARNGWILDVAPGVRIEHVSPRARIFADYRIHGLAYTADSMPDETQQFLNATAGWKSIDEFLVIDARANIIQQARSPFAGAVAPDAPSTNGNRGETRAFEISPSINGSLADRALYQLRLVEAEANAAEIGIPRTRSTTWMGRLHSPSTSNIIGWSFDASQLQVRNRAIGELEDVRVRAILSMTVLPTARLSLLYGHEVTDFLGGERKGSLTPGAGLDWVPNERTQLSMAWERRFFGDGYNLFLVHRTPRTAWRATGSRTVSVLPNQLASANLRSVSSLLSDLLASAQPDPVQRATLVRARMDETFLPENTTVTSGLLSAQPFVLETIEAHGALIGRRNTVTLTVARREQRRIRELDGLGGADEVLRSGITMNWAYRVTPVSTFMVSATYLRTEDLTNVALPTTDRALSALYATRLGLNTTFSIGARRAQVQGSAAMSYTENALVIVFSARI